MQIAYSSQTLAEGQPALADRLRREAAERPAVALASAQLLKNARHRDRLLREAFLSACIRDRKAARTFLPVVSGRPWLGDADFFDAIAIGAKELLIASAARHPEVALREWESYASLPFAREVIETAARMAPEEAVAVARGRLPRELEPIASRTDLDLPSKARAAVLFRSIARGEVTIEQAATPKPAEYFSFLVNARLKSSGEESVALDRALESYSLRLCREYRDGIATADLREFSVRDLYLLLAYGRGEEDEDFFGIIFDKLLAPKLRDASALVRETGFLRYRSFVSAAVGFGRFNAFLRSGQSDDLIARIVLRLEQEAEPALETAVAIEALETLPVARFKNLLVREYQRVHDSGDADAEVLYGLLAARFHIKTGTDYSRFLHDPKTIALSSLLDSRRIVVERYFFYNDEDGVDSFQSFLNGYQGGGWHVERLGDYVKVKSQRMEIYANIPEDLTRPLPSVNEESVKRRQETLSRTLAAQGITPRVIVHRGHNYHLDKTIASLTPEARLVYLGSCWGMGKIGRVMELAPQAQVIATRGVASTSVNEPMLRSLNEAILHSGATLDWTRFWAGMSGWLGGKENFSGYIPPYRNSAAILLRGYYEAIGGNH